MKKMISVLICVCLLLTLSVTVAFAAVNGDISSDNNVGAEDARLILRSTVGLENLSDSQKASADLDLDGQVTAADARIALRIAVGLDIIDKSVYITNEYEALKSGNYRTKFTRTASGEDDNVVALAVTEGASFFETRDFAVSEIMGSSAGNKTMNLAIYTNKDGLFFCDDAHESYANLNGVNEILGEKDAVAFSADDFSSELAMFADFPELSDATAVANGTFNKKACTVYTFTSSGADTKIYMAGKTLLGIETFNTKGVSTGTYTFEYVNFWVPKSDVSLPADYTDMSDDVLLFLLEAFGEALGF